MAETAWQNGQEAVAEEALLEEVAARRLRLAENLDVLGTRLAPANLLAEAVDAGRRAVTTEYDRLRTEFLDLGADMIEDSLAWTASHKRWIIGGSITALLVAGAIALATRKRTVPLYAAYDMEDPDMMNDEHPIDDAADRAQRAWDKVKDSADDLGHTVADRASELGHTVADRASELGHTVADRASELGHTVAEKASDLGNKAGEAYYAARSRAAELADVARDQAAHAAEVARQRAHEAAEAARDAADRAREAAGDAGRWARRQPQENPMTVVIVALAVGAIVGALITSERRRDA